MKILKLILKSLGLLLKNILGNDVENKAYYKINCNNNNNVNITLKELLSDISYHEKNDNDNEFSLDSKNTQNIGIQIFSGDSIPFIYTKSIDADKNETYIIINLMNKSVNNEINEVTKEAKNSIYDPSVTPNALIDIIIKHCGRPLYKVITDTPFKSCYETYCPGGCFHLGSLCVDNNNVVVLQDGKDQIVLIEVGQYLFIQK
ncbi:hypothetical protein PIROE2DRAFT_8868 [Piromyces sp. E2]|nr:hypothetical protein PIROE2DRAFT_8868 [Piromyces sp. E2]|eukprot:OUM64393.1 hypothetical protein PIROE2DRAFT_8868 [Piromyces sp. E2]